MRRISSAISMLRRSWDLTEQRLTSSFGSIWLILVLLGGIASYVAYTNLDWQYKTVNGRPQLFRTDEGWSYASYIGVALWILTSVWSAAIAYRIINGQFLPRYRIKRFLDHQKQIVRNKKLGVLALLISWCLTLIPIVAIIALLIIFNIPASNFYAYFGAGIIGLCLITVINAFIGQAAILVWQEDLSLKQAFKKNISLAKLAPTSAILFSFFLIAGYILLSFLFSLISILVSCFLMAALFFGTAPFFVVFHLFLCSFLAVCLLFWAAMGQEVIKELAPKPVKPIKSAGHTRPVKNRKKSGKKSSKKKRK